MIGLPETHIFEPTLRGLQRQNFKDIELIVSDCRYETRPDCFNGKPFRREDYDFEIKHVPVKPNFWLERGMWTGPGTWNKGIVQAEGELLIFIDDCSEYPEPNALNLYWEWHQRGYFASALVLYNKGGEPLYMGEEAKRLIRENQPLPWRSTADNMDRVFNHGERVKDSRWRFVENSNYFFFPGQMYYAYSACSMEAILKVNGWDENLDGDKTLADVDIGLRLEQIGCKFVLDRRLTVIENCHKAIPKDTLWYEGKPVRSNYELMRMNRAKGRWRANSYRLNDQEIEWLRTHREKEDTVPIQQPGTKEYELFMHWAKNPPIFDLRELRML
jgi:hypothetical protein